MKRVFLTLLFAASVFASTNAQTKALLIEGDGFRWYRVYSDKYVGAWDKGQNVIISPSRKYDKIYYVEVDGKKGYFNVVKNKKQGVCSIDGEEIIAPKYNEIIYTNEFKYKDKKGQYQSTGIILSSNGKAIYPAGTKPAASANKGSGKTNPKKLEPIKREYKTSNLYRKEDGFTFEYYIYHFSENGKTMYAAFSTDGKRITPNRHYLTDISYKGGGIFSVQTGDKSSDGESIIEGYNLKGKKLFPASLQIVHISYEGNGFFVLEHRLNNKKTESVYNTKGKCIIPASLEYNWIAYYPKDKAFWCSNLDKGIYRTYTLDGKYFAEGYYHSFGDYSATLHYNLSDPSNKRRFDIYKFKASKAKVTAVESGRRGIDFDNYQRSVATRQTYTPSYNPTYTPSTQTPTYSQPTQQQRTTTTPVQEKCKYCTGDGRCHGYNTTILSMKQHCGGSGKCSNCYGSGLMTTGFGTDKIKCSYCNGTGKCKICKGTGKCEKCGGRGIR